MIALATALWPGLAAASLLGLLVGLVTGLPRALPSVAAAASLIAALAVLAGLAALGQVAGEAGLRIETAGLMLATYLTGCLLGALAEAIMTASR